MTANHFKRAEMKITLTILLAVMLTLSAASLAVAEDNLLSANVGIFMPGDNYGDSYDSLGGSLGFSFIRVNEYAGLEVGLTSYHIGGSPNDTTAIGLDLLVHFQQRDFDFQPYIALGMGVLSTEYGYSGGTLNDIGTGLVIKAGARYFFDLKRNEYSFEKDKYFVGVYLKYFSDVILDDRVPYNTRDLDVGGRCICIEAGVWTD
jgi:hypothetical protein